MSLLVFYLAITTASYSSNGKATFERTTTTTTAKTSNNTGQNGPYYGWGTRD